MARVLCANHNMVSEENSQIQSVKEKKNGNLMIPLGVFSKTVA